MCTVIILNVQLICIEWIVGLVIQPAMAVSIIYGLDCGLEQWNMELYEWNMEFKFF